MLRVEGLTLRYPTGKQALAGVDVDVSAGELLIVLGGNGCGKTTLLRCITRALRRCAGAAVALLTAAEAAAGPGRRRRGGQGRRRRRRRRAAAGAEVAGP